MPVWGRVTGEAVWGGYRLKSICEPGKRESGSLVSWHVAGAVESRELVPRYRPAAVCGQRSFQDKQNIYKCQKEGSR